MAGAKLKPILRMIDANLNRSKEALRVAEDICRFVLKNSSLTGAFKRVRHEVTAAAFLFPVSYQRLLDARDSFNDVGKDSAISDASDADWRDLLTANLKRAQESLRVLEECSKLISQNSSAAFQRLRFRCYELERKSVSQF